MVGHGEVGGGGGGGSPQGENGVSQPWTGCRKPLPRAGWAISLALCTTGCRNSPVTL